MSEPAIALLPRTGHGLKIKRRLLRMGWRNSSTVRVRKAGVHMRLDVMVSPDAGARQVHERHLAI